MIENLPKNGSFVARRKVFNQFPFHSLNHSLPFNWMDDQNYSQQLQRKHNRQIQEHQYIRRVYNQKIQRKLQEKFGYYPDVNRGTSNETNFKKDEQVLAKEIQHFNNSKLTPATNPEYQDNVNLQPSHQSAQQIFNKPPVDSRYHSYVPDDNFNSNNGSNQGISSPRNRQQKNMSRKEQIQEQGSPNYGQNGEYQGYSPEVLRRHYLPRNYGPQSLKDYHKYSEIINNSNIETPHHPLRNYLPDRLEGFLRDKSRVQRKKPINVSLSLQNRQKI